MPPNKFNKAAVAILSEEVFELTADNIVAERVLAEMGCFQRFTGIMTSCRKHYVTTTGMRLRIIMKAHMSALPLSEADQAILLDFELRLQSLQK